MTLLYHGSNSEEFEPHEIRYPFWVTLSYEKAERRLRTDVVSNHFARENAVVLITKHENYSGFLRNVVDLSKCEPFTENMR